MTRKKTQQQGAVSLHRDQWTLRIRELDHATGKWANRRVVLGKFKDENEARQAAAPIIKDVNKRNNTEPKKLYSQLTFKDFVESQWKAYTVIRKHRTTTLEMRDSLMQIHLLPFFGRMKMRAIQPAHVVMFLAEKRQKYSDSTMKALYKLLRLLFSIAEENKLIKKSPVKKGHLPEFEKVKKPTLSAAQIRQVISNLEDGQERLLVLLLAVTGMRVHEAMALRWLDFNAPECELSINHTLYKGKLVKPKTAASAASLRLHPSIAGSLAAHKEQSAFQSASHFIFCRPDGQPLSYGVSLNHLHRAIEDAGITRQRGKHGFHILRHSAGTLLYTKSRDLKLVQGTLRHADLSTTSDIYVHLSDEVLSEGSRVLTDEILGNGSPTVPQESKMVS